ncbi:GntR family transcriptional regulator [Flavobacterium gilvum]|uniref:GntR family transcriptional regulator n=1 Tax=Flavobacterium gilvum TaxID=1492737 RepID=A0AAC9I284_9FLAO|nr:GntR family transcriptional regulator [Flavobacterium gilvum]AOW08062.1 GntR family transcriptional regulator [Flavobacterium gilvum]KFC57743.1 GntR family transcriptional regulator [Flavobacterium gilvum]
MDFKSTKGIYLQIVDALCRQILEGELKQGDRVASVRDLAAEFEVNHNTVMRAYANLQDAGIFDNKRGVGFFISEKALDLIKENEKSNFFSQDLPDFLLKVKLLKLNSADLNELLSVIKNNDHEDK